MMVLDDEETTVASNETNKASLVESVGSKAIIPALRTGCNEKVEV
jgi:hypothetical protein